MLPDFTTGDIAAMLSRARRAGNECKSSFAAGCRCPRHFSLREFRTERGQPDLGLAPVDVQPTDLFDACDGSMTCSCSSCSTDRAKLVRIGGQGSGARQPWQPLPASAPRAA